MCLCTLDTNLRCEIYHISYYVKKMCAEKRVIMKEYFGKKIFGGIAIGKISFYSKNQNVVVRKKT